MGVKILYFADSARRGCGATVRFETGEPCMISIAQSGIIVKKSRHFFWGAILYNEKNVYKNAQCALALAYLFPERRFPDGVSDNVLRAFFNAILHSASTSEVCVTLNEAVKSAEKKAGCAFDKICLSDIPSWATNHRQANSTIDEVVKTAPLTGTGATPDSAICISAANSIEGIPKEFATLKALFGMPNRD